MRPPEPAGVTIDSDLDLLRRALWSRITIDVMPADIYMKGETTLTELLVEIGFSQSEDGETFTRGDLVLDYKAARSLIHDMILRLKSAS